MERKTKIHAEDGQQDLLITREFELPVQLLFKAFEDAALLSQWMGTQVLKLENKQHGSYQFETKDAQGNPVFRAHGAIHAFVPLQKITRTFEMENAPFPPQLEFLEFEPLGEEKSRLTMRIVYKSAGHRSQMLQLPFAQGLNRAHNRLQAIVEQLNN